jgi:hypothetical protein
MTTASTVGYGDLNPSTDRREKTSLAVRQFVTVLLIFFGICVIFARLSNLIGAHAPSTVVTAALRRSECRHTACAGGHGCATLTAAAPRLRPRPPSCGRAPRRPWPRSRSAWPLSSVAASIFKPLFRHIRDILEKIFPQETVDIDGDGVADFKLPRTSAGRERASAAMAEGICCCSAVIAPFASAQLSRVSRPAPQARRRSSTRRTCSRQCSSRRSCS